MDIHRCRFVPYEPQSIDAVAFSHISNSKQKTPKGLKLALGRQNGDIEIWNPARGEWTQERIFRGGTSRTIDSLQWTQDLLLPDEDDDTSEPLKIEYGTPRLFSSGGTTSITEWDVKTGVPKAHVEGNADDIWCFAAQPQWTHNQARTYSSDAQAAPSQLLAAGCADGSIILFSTSDNELRFDRVLSRPHSKKSRCTSITWRDRNVVIAGYEESHIRVFDVRSRQVLRALNLGKGREGDKPVVWAVKCLPNGTLLSGDSLGELKIWDASNFSQVQRIKAHAADIMDIANNASGTMILTCGVDRRTVAYAPQSNSGSAKTQRWHEIRHRRFHEHDVKSMTTFESTHLSIAVSGGIDTVPVVLPLKNWNEEYHRSLSHLPQRPQMSVSSAARILFTWWSNYLYLWHLSPRLAAADHATLQADGLDNEKLLACIKLEGDEHITSANISPNGSLVVAATNAGVSLFQIRRTTAASGQSIIRSRQVKVPRAIAQQGATAVGFSPDSKWLYAVRLNGVLSLLKINAGPLPKDEPRVSEHVTKLDRKRRSATDDTKTQFTSYAKTINTVAFSSDSRILAVGDLSGNIDTWVLQGHETDDVSRPPRASSESSAEDSDSDDSEDETDSRVVQGQKWIRTPAGSQLPSLDSAILSMAFKRSEKPVQHPSQISGNEGIHATRHNPHPVSPELPASEAGYLIAVTANHQIIMFDTLGCRLADWSRQNPSSQLPQSFKKIKERVMGIWLDTRPTQGIDRLWLYGSNFIYMMDLSQSLASMRQNSSSLVKIGKLGNHVLEVAPDHALVRNDDGPPTKKRKHNMGAGDSMREDQRYATTMQSRDENGDAEMRMPSPPQSDGESDSVESDAEEVENAEPTSGDTDSEAESKATGPATWSTFQYRAIYGACALTPSADSDEASVQPEVVIVERPTYDIVLPPRFAENKDW